MPIIVPQPLLPLNVSPFANSTNLKANGEVIILNKVSTGTPRDNPYKYIPKVWVPAFNLAKANSLALSVERDRKAEASLAASDSHSWANK
mgnify:FL=1